MVIKPYGFSIWENFKYYLDKKIKDSGHKNAYFPLLIPKSFLSKEAAHIDGFATECAVVTHYRLKAEEGKMVVDEKAKLEEELIIRPTSETIIYDSYSRWIESYRDLPLKINQWANVMRWEMRTRPFLRTSEFLWQEGHTCHETNEEAKKEQEEIMSLYEWFGKEILAINGVVGYKTKEERFAGADTTLTMEQMMPDGKALQSCTSHNLGQNFSKAFNIEYTSKEGQKELVWQTSWGMSTRMLGGLIMSHSDNDGLVLPPKIAPIKVVIIPIYKTEEQKELVFKKAKKIQKELQEELTFESYNQEIKLDDRDWLRFGEKSFEWEKKGVPIRIEIGERDIKENKAILVRRDTKEKIGIQIDDLIENIKRLNTEIQNNLKERSNKILEENTIEVTKLEELKNYFKENTGFVYAWERR